MEKIRFQKLYSVAIIQRMKEIDFENVYRFQEYSAMYAEFLSKYWSKSYFDSYNFFGSIDFSTQNLARKSTPGSLKFGVRCTVYCRPVVWHVGDRFMWLIKLDKESSLHTLLIVTDWFYILMH